MKANSAKNVPSWEATQSYSGYDRYEISVQKSILDGAVQRVVPKTLCQKLLKLAHYAIKAGHSGTTIYYTVNREYYCLQMASGTFFTARNFRNCTRHWETHFEHRKQIKPMKLFLHSIPSILSRWFYLARWRSLRGALSLFWSQPTCSPMWRSAFRSKTLQTLQLPLRFWSTGFTRKASPVHPYHQREDVCCQGLQLRMGDFELRTLVHRSLSSAYDRVNWASQ